MGMQGVDATKSHLVHERPDRILDRVLEPESPAGVTAYQQSIGIEEVDENAAGARMVEVSNGFDRRQGPKVVDIGQFDEASQHFVCTIRRGQVGLESRRHAKEMNQVRR